MFIHSYTLMCVLLTLISGGNDGACNRLKNTHDLKMPCTRQRPIDFYSGRWNDDILHKINISIYRLLYVAFLLYCFPFFLTFFLFLYFGIITFIFHAMHFTYIFQFQFVASDDHHLFQFDFISCCHILFISFFFRFTYFSFKFININALRTSDWSPIYVFFSFSSFKFLFCLFIFIRYVNNQLIICTKYNCRHRQYAEIEKKNWIYELRK